jgi:hypothetical protein
MSLLQYYTNYSSCIFVRMDRGSLFRGSQVGLYFPLVGVALYYRGLSPCVLICNLRA